MDSILNLDEPPLTPEEIEEVKQNARERLRLWKRRALYAAEAFVLSCALVYPISKGAPLHAYAHVFGIFLVALAEAFSSTRLLYWPPVGGLEVSPRSRKG